ncbi:sucrase ferredoxin [Nocardia sp. Marseille-Q1738]
MSDTTSSDTARVHSCSYLAGLLGDSLVATATEATAWLLVEHPGPWGKDALKESGLPELFVQAAAEKSAVTGVRIQLISPPEGEPAQRCYLAGDPLRTTPWLAWQPLPDLWSVLDIDFAALAAGRIPDSATLMSEPLYAVCANDRSDPCCGSTGPAVWAGVAEAIGGRCRRTAHVGGHKYAANMVAFPHAVFYGRLDARTALDIVRTHDGGNVYLDRYRGRSAFALPEQAAEYFLRMECGHTRLGGIALAERARALENDCYSCAFDLDGVRYEVRVGSRRRAPARLQSCTDERPSVPVEWNLDAIQVVEPSTGVR